MKRNNGFLDLNEYFRKIKQANKWHNYDFLVSGIIEPSHYSRSQYWLKIKGKKYYFKPTNYPYHELVAYYIAKYLGYDATFYDLAELKDTHSNNVKGVISESFKKKNAKYISGYTILKEYYEKYPDLVTGMGLTDEWKEYYDGPYYIHMNNLEIIWQALEERYKKRTDVNIKALIDDIINQYIFAILIRTHDKGAQNWEIEETSEGVKICPIFDNEISFYDEGATAVLSVNFDDNDKSIKDTVRKFLTISSEEYVELFLNKFYYLELEDFLNIINKVESHIGCEIPFEVKKEIIDNFELNQKEIKEVLEELNLKAKGR